MAEVTHAPPRTKKDNSAITSDSPISDKVTLNSQTVRESIQPGTVDVTKRMMAPLQKKDNVLPADSNSANCNKVTLNTETVGEDIRHGTEKVLDGTKGAIRKKGVKVPDEQKFRNAVFSFLTKAAIEKHNLAADFEAEFVTARQPRRNMPRYPCYYCEKWETTLSHHYILAHKDELIIQQLDVTIGAIRKKGVKVPDEQKFRIVVFSFLTKAAIEKHNLAADFEAEFVTARRPRQNMPENKVSDFAICSYCRGLYV
ncbi:hypothetical protein TSAR_010457 [Trichomalopsis sarcophagae]|uniref:Uncharacterized protein n=1 Tax=Trichomalopsis sarcophagae TaxID=543379 RepID=A0A232EHR3_9HYME|nr:hypothetical protein TSAR_010457 [Trichomalopsis sarcophagae]